VLATGLGGGVLLDPVVVRALLAPALALSAGVRPSHQLDRPTRAFAAIAINPAAESACGHEPRAHRGLCDMTQAAPLPPTMRGGPVLGLLPDLRRDVLGTLERARREHGDVVRLLAGPPRLRSTSYAVFHPDAVRRVLATEADRYRKDNRFYNEIRWALGDGLLNSQDERWLRQRRFVQPLFTRRRIATYAAAMGEASEALVGGWSGTARSGEPIELHGEMSRVTLRIVGRLLFGADVERAVPVVTYAFPLLGEYARRRSYNPASPPHGWPTRANRQALRAQRSLYDTCDEIIARRRSNGAGGEDLLSQLVAAGDGEEALSDTEIRDQVLIFLLAGHDTTAIALTFALHLLGHQRDVQARVQEEVDGALGGRTPGAEDVERLPYTTMVLKEAMRLYPPAWVVPRRAGATDEIDGHLVPAGVDVLLSPWVTHRHPEFWEHPERFYPSVSIPEREAERHRHSYFPFGAGPRACIGQYFSMLEAVIALAVIVREFELQSLTERVPLAPRITLHPAAPVPCRLTPRRAAS
jgi:cytochrome P450